MGLTHPVDLDAWHQWQRSQTRLRSLRRRQRPAQGETMLLTTFGTAPVLLVALDSGSPTSRFALIEPLIHLDVPFAVISPGAPPVDIPGPGPHVTTTLSTSALPDALRGIKAAVALGHYMPRGATAYEWARELSVPFFVVQHGALTPYTPPLPTGARLLSWSDSDAAYWTTGRADVDHEVVGAQLLWTASARPALVQRDAPLTYLGQGHAAELPRSRLARAALAFTRSHDAVYRPHPSEHDKLSRLTHAAYARLGVEVDATTPLNELTSPVVSVFSTGVLEAAAQGRDAWVDFPEPPTWLREFWDRYGMHEFGNAPTPAPPRLPSEPAHRVASILRSVVS